MKEEKISLYYKDGGSDKVYHAQIVRAIVATAVPATGEDWVVNFQYGRRGQSLQTGTKTAKPVTFDKAKKVFDKLVAEKKGKGYTEGEDGTPFQGTDKAGEVSGLVPQLLNSISRAEAEKLLDASGWIMQEKKDGVRLMVEYNGESVTGTNKKGLIVPVPSPVVIAVRNMAGDASDLVLDGELVGDTYWVFDMLKVNGENIRGVGFLERFVHLAMVFQKCELPLYALEVVPIAGDPLDKKKLFDTIEKERREGVVFKRQDAKYVPGRPNSGGNQLKFKFKGSATCRVNGVNEGKRSVSLLVLDNNPLKPGQLAHRDVGNVTIPANFPVPAWHTLVEVEYLYAYPGGSLFQPVYKGPRPDQTEADLYSSLKFKAGTADEEDEG